MIPTDSEPQDESDVRRKQSQENHTHEMERSSPLRRTTLAEGKVFLDAHKKRSSFSDSDAHLDPQVLKHSIQVHGEYTFLTK